VILKRFTGDHAIGSEVRAACLRPSKTAKGGGEPSSGVAARCPAWRWAEPVVGTQESSLQDPKREDGVAADLFRG
jgi:hypothetical protein